MKSFWEKCRGYLQPSLVFLLAVFMKQFYLLESGSFQIGDLLFMLSAAACAWSLRRELAELPGALREKRISLSGILKGHGLLYVYFFLAILIDLIYFLRFPDSDASDFRFYKSAAYMVFNGILVLCFLGLRYREGAAFLHKLRYALMLCPPLQLLILALGLGRTVFGRFAGSFNDPNQCAFFVFAEFLLFYVLSEREEKRRLTLPVFLCTVTVVVAAQSMGALLGILALTPCMLYRFLKRSDRLGPKTLLPATAVITAAVILVLLTKPYAVVSLTSRIADKIRGFDLFSGRGLMNLFEDRCWDKLLLYPKQMLWGAGEGNYERFPSIRYPMNEVHSSLFTALFCYGILPFGCLLTWMVLCFKKADGAGRIVLTALLAEAMMLNNTRNPYFWLLFVVAACREKEKTK